MDRVAVMALPLLVLLLLLLSRCSAAAAAPRHGEGRWGEGEGEWRPAVEEEKGKGKEGRGLFVLDRLEKVVESEGGQVHVVRGQPWPPAAFACREGLMHIGFITMEPKTLFVPQYLDSSITLFVHRGMHTLLLFLSMGACMPRHCSRTLAPCMFSFLATLRLVVCVYQSMSWNRGIYDMMMSRGSEGWVYSQG